jgi:hypothetical protein
VCSFPQQVFEIAVSSSPLSTVSTIGSGLFRGAMADAEFADFSIVDHGPAFCGTATCPFCFLSLPHNASKTIVARRCEEITAGTREQIRCCTLHCATQVSAMRKILSVLEPTARVPVAYPIANLFEANFAAQDDWFMRPQGDPNQPPPGRGVTSASSAGADGGTATGRTTATGSEGITRGESRFMDTDEHPQWQFQGEKKFKWTPYDRDSNERLEDVFGERVLQTVSLGIGDWQYEIELVSFTQLSLQTNMQRGVRRLMGPSAA